jgi:hypothetical protein
VSLALVTLALTACSSTYYQVKDPVSGKEYYTTSIKRSGDTVQFKDARSLSEVRLQNSEIMQITKDQYKSKTGAPR